MSSAFHSRLLGSAGGGEGVLVLDIDMIKAVSWSICSWEKPVGGGSLLEPSPFPSTMSTGKLSRSISSVMLLRSEGVEV